MPDAPSPPTWHSEVNKDRTAQEDLPIGIHLATPAAIDIDRPTMPVGEDQVWYRGWECGWDQQQEYWTGSGYGACKGGFDLDAPYVTAGTWAGLLDEVDEQEDK